MFSGNYYLFCQFYFLEIPKPTMKIQTNYKYLITKLIQTKPSTFNVNRNMSESPEQGNHFRRSEDIMSKIMLA